MYSNSCTLLSYILRLLQIANKVYPDQTAPEELSDQNILDLPMCGPRRNNFVNADPKNDAVWITSCAILANKYSRGINIFREY